MKKALISFIGKTTCYISIDGDRWVVNVKKSYKGKWEVVDYHLYSDDEGEWLAPDDEQNTSKKDTRG